MDLGSRLDTNGLALAKIVLILIDAVEQVLDVLLDLTGALPSERREVETSLFKQLRNAFLAVFLLAERLRLGLRDVD